MDRTLLLNLGYEPLRIIDWKRAIRLTLLEKVDVLEEYERLIRSAHLAMRVPAVVRLRRYAPFHRLHVRFSRANIYARDAYSCQYCGKRFPERDLTFDHVVPRSAGGTTTWRNIVTSCLRCNKRKGNGTPAEAGLTLRQPPRRPTMASALFTPRGRDCPHAWRHYLG